MAGTDDRASRMAALISIVACTRPELRPHLPDLAALPAPFSLLDLDDAADLLLLGDDDESRRLRAYAAATAAEASEHTEALAPIAERLIGDRHGFHQLRSQGVTVFSAAYKALRAPRFTVTAHDLGVQFDPVTFVTTVRVQMTVERELDDELARTLDPQSWYQPPGDFFFKASRRGVLVQGTFTPQPDPPGAGWRAPALLYEHVTWNAGDFKLIEFKNLLDTSFDVRRIAGVITEVEMRYALHQCLRGTVGLLERDGGIDVDSGYSRVTCTPQEVTIDAVKKIRYTDYLPGLCDGPVGSSQFLNYLAPAVVGVWLDLIVYQGLCE